MAKQKFILTPDERGSITEEIPFVGAGQVFSAALAANNEATLSVPTDAKRFKLTVAPGGFVYVGFGNTPITIPTASDPNWSTQVMEPNPILRGLKNSLNEDISTLRFISTTDTQINVIFYD